MVNVDNFMILNSTFRGQGYSGTALELVNTTAQIVNCTFSSNRNGKTEYFFSNYYSYSRQVGGAIIANHSNVSISHSIFVNNGAYYIHYGGAIFAEQQSILNIYTSVFINNSGLLGMLYSSSCNIRIEASKFSNNNALLDGVLNSYHSTIKIKSNDSEFHNSSVYYYDSGIVTMENGSMATVEQNLFKGNNGSAISCDNSSITIKTNGFYDNFGDNEMLRIQGCIMCMIQDVKVYNNSLGIFMRDSICRINASEFKHNVG